MKQNVEQITISLPDQKNYEIGYGLALKLASKKLSGLQDIVEQCEKSESICQVSGSSQIIHLKYLHSTYQIALPEMEISLANSSSKVDLRDKILILDYFTRARGTPLSGIPFAYQDIREGATYYPSFFSRAVKPLIDYFGSTPERLLDVASELGGFKADFGDVAVTIPAFNRVPVTLVIWRGDEEFPPNANILFDSNIQDYLSVEDIVVLCQTISWRLVKSLLAKSNPVKR